MWAIPRLRTSWSPSDQQNRVDVKRLLLRVTDGIRVQAPTGCYGYRLHPSHKQRASHAKPVGDKSELPQILNQRSRLWALKKDTVILAAFVNIRRTRNQQVALSIFGLKYLGSFSTATRSIANHMAQSPKCVLRLQTKFRYPATMCPVSRATPAELKTLSAD